MGYKSDLRDWQDAQGVSAAAAAARHGGEVSEEVLGSEDRLIGYQDCSYGWQARGSNKVYVFRDRDAAIRDYEA